MELELDEEKRRHAETIKILRKKERQVKEIMVQVEEDQTQIQALSDSLDKVNQKVNIYKRQLQEQVSPIGFQNILSQILTWRKHLFYHKRQLQEQKGTT